MWLVIRWILLPLAVGRRIHPSIGEFKRFNDRSKDFRKRRGSSWPKGGAPGPQRRLRKSFDRLLSLSNEGWIQQSIGESIEYPTTFNQTIEDLLQ